MKNIRKIATILIINSIIFLSIDLLIGNKIEEFYLDKRLIAEKKYRISNKVYHHTLKPNFKGYGYWNAKYKICTNKYGFKNSCETTIKDNLNYDFVFIGDSFTESVGIEYNNSFVGLFEKYSGLNVANMGVSSYSPSIYYNKINFFLNEGLKTNRVIVFIDISDIEDEALRYTRKSKIIVYANETVTEKKIKNFLKENLVLTFELIKFVERSINEITVLFKSSINTKKNHFNNLLEEKNNPRSAWTYKKNITVYNLDNAIKKTLNEMKNLHKLLEKNNIKLSVAVYPWPDQILYDIEDSIQVKIWKEFCSNRCEYFIDYFKIFFDEKKEINSEKIIRKYFINEDVHLNKLGNQLVFEELKKVFF